MDHAAPTGAEGDPPTELVLYTRPGCSLCDETRDHAGRPPRPPERRGPPGACPRRARHRDRPGLGAGVLRRDPGRRAGRSAADPGDEPGADRAPPGRGPRRMSLGSDLTFLVAIAAGLVSFLSPCVLPLVPAYLGQLTAVAVAAAPEAGRPSRWVALRHAAAYVARLRHRVHPPRDHRDVRRRGARPVAAAPAPGRRDRPHRDGPEPGRGPDDRPAPADVAAARPRRQHRRRRGDRRDRPPGSDPRRARAWPTGSADGWSAAAAGCSPRSGSGRSSRSAGRRASGRSWAGS